MRDNESVSIDSTAWIMGTEAWIMGTEAKPIACGKCRGIISDESCISIGSRRPIHHECYETELAAQNVRNAVARVDVRC